MKCKSNPIVVADGVCVCPFIWSPILFLFACIFKMLKYRKKKSCTRPIPLDTLFFLNRSKVKPHTHTYISRSNISTCISSICFDSYIYTFILSVYYFFFYLSIFMGNTWNIFNFVRNVWNLLSKKKKLAHLYEFILVTIKKKKKAEETKGHALVFPCFSSCIIAYFRNWWHPLAFLRYIIIIYLFFFPVFITFISWQIEFKMNFFETWYTFFFLLFTLRGNDEWSWQRNCIGENRVRYVSLVSDR